jgi:uncharacterized membrane protein YtjA (UPF0391 family)
MNTAKQTPPPEIQRRDDIFKALANVPILISVIAVYAFFLSSLYVTSLTEAFGFPIANLLTSIDYIQFIPQTLVIRYKEYVLFCIPLIPLLFIVLIRLVFVLPSAHPADPTKPWQPRWFFERLAQVKARLGFAGMTGNDAWEILKISFWVCVILLLWSFAWDTYRHAGNFVKHEICCTLDEPRH